MILNVVFRLSVSQLEEVQTQRLPTRPGKLKRIFPAKRSLLFLVMCVVKFANATSEQLLEFYKVCVLKIRSRYGSKRCQNW